jgi:hypothetical protein
MDHQHFLCPSSFVSLKSVTWYEFIPGGDAPTAKSSQPARGRDASNALASLNCFNRLITLFAEGAKHYPFR